MSALGWQAAVIGHLRMSPGRIQLTGFDAFMTQALQLPDYGLLHFERRATRSPVGIERTAACPSWTLVLLLACPSVLLARAMHRDRYSRRHNLCLNCGYDLTGNKSGVCPECGTPTEAPA